MNRNLTLLLVGLVAALIVASLTLFTVDQRQHAIVFRLGEPVNVIRSPGLYLKVPLLDNVRFFDVRILTLDADDPERFITSEKKNVLVDSFVKFRIVDVLQYYISVEVVAGERDRIMELMRAKADADARTIGVEVLDVRLKRVDLPQEVSEAVYRRMEAERKRVANELRSLGFAEAEKIRADAERQRSIIIAEAYRDAQRVKGEGDARSAAIYARAFEQNPEFFAFYRSMEAYRQSFKSRSDVMVIDPSSDFFRYLEKPGGRR
jgi:membrane protease subunit HflC